MTVIRWEDPPEHGNNKPKPPSKYQPIVDALRSHPGQWAVVLEVKAPGTAGGLANRIRSGVGSFAPPGSFESKVRGSGGGSSMAKVYARYVGQAQLTSQEDSGADHA